MRRPVPFGARIEASGEIEMFGDFNSADVGGSEIIILGILDSPTITINGSTEADIITMNP